MSSSEYIKNQVISWIAPLKNTHPPIYLVGGAVRDYLLGRISTDFDLVCKHGKQLAQELSKIWKTKMVAFEKQAQTSCYRLVDFENPGKFLDITPMRGAELETDLLKRDFTINSLAIQVSAQGFGQITDPLGGRQDLQQGLVRMNTEESLVSDPLRILRAFRFSAQLNFAIAGQTRLSLKTKAYLLKHSAPERILNELLLLLQADKSYKVLLSMDQLGVLETLLPEIIPLKGCTQNFYHHLDVWQHSLEVVQNCEFILNNLEVFFPEQKQAVYAYLKQDARWPLLKLAALLHDVGKPKTRDVPKNKGRVTFYGHDKIGADIVLAICERLRMSRQMSRFMSLLVQEHLHVLDLADREVKPSTRMKFLRKTGDDCLAIFILAVADIQATLGEKASYELHEEQINWCKEMVREYLTSIKKQLEQRALINGNDLLDMGLSPGPQLGRILKEVQQARDDGEIKTKEEALEWVGRQYLNSE